MDEGTMLAWASVRERPPSCPLRWRYVGRWGARDMKTRTKWAPGLAVLVAVVAIGCGASHPDRRTEPCRAKDLRPDADARKFGAFQPQGGAAVGGVVLTNRGSGPCVLRGRPVVELRPTYGQRQRLVKGTLPAPSPRVRTVLLRPGESAVVGLSWANCCRKSIPSALRIRLPGDGEIALLNPGAPQCLAPGRPTVVGVEPFAHIPAA
jgi:hypothetical protein